MDSTSPAVLLKVLSSALFIVTLRPPIEVTTIVMSSDILMLYPRSTRFRPHIKKVAGLISHSCFFCVQLACSFLCLTAWQRQAVIGWFQSVIGAAIENKRMSCTSQLNKYTTTKWHEHQIGECDHLVDVCLFTLTERLLTDNLVSCHTPHVCLCIRGNWQRTSSDEHVLSFCSGSPVKTALGSSKCSPLSWPGQHGNCVRNYGN